MSPGARRALVGALSIAAVLLPAGGIAYLGAVSYREDRGLVAAKIDEQIRAAQGVAAAVEREIERALDRVAAAVDAADGDRLAPAARDALAAAEPLARQAFYLGAGGELRTPAPEALRPSGPAAEAGFLAPTPRLGPGTPRSCPGRAFESCVRALREARRRQALLDAARRAELTACPAPPCRGARAIADARARYLRLVADDDTGPDALLGLIRLARAAGDERHAVAHLAEALAPYGHRSDGEGLSYALLAVLAAAGVDVLATPTGADEPPPTALLAIVRGIVDRRYEAPSPALGVIADRLLARVRGGALGDGERAELAALDEALRRGRADERFAAALAADTAKLARAAGPEARGQPTVGDDRTLVYRRHQGSVVGLVLDRADLEAAAARSGVDLSAMGPGARAAILRVGSSPPAALRTLATAGLGESLPHLAVALVNDRSMTDPLDVIVARRGRRHLIITGALAALLVVGLFATIRSAARERELARLKSDFVSTVSHELKTPLTSIRMFAEMLQQGVAQGDREREGRYHDVIVKESQRLGLLIANLLDYAQIERGTRRYTRRAESLTEVAAEAIETFTRLREGADPQVELVIEPALAVAAAHASIDREVVIQSLLNLLANAVKYGGAAPITVRVARRGDATAVSVTDRGPGIPAAEQARIFREFYRAPAAYSSGVEGTGLGLALVKRHVEAQGGTVEVESTLGRGATFTVILPAAEPGEAPA